MIDDIPVSSGRDGAMESTINGGPAGDSMSYSIGRLW